LKLKKKSSIQAFCFKKNVVSGGFLKKKNSILTHDLGQVNPRLGFLTMGHCCLYLIIKKNLNPTDLSLLSKTQYIMDCYSIMIIFPFMFVRKGMSFFFFKGEIVLFHTIQLELSICLRVRWSLHIFIEHLNY